jgi:UDPglucose--hexose-1-phosphate uridylyltransferase
VPGSDHRPDRYAVRHHRKADGRSLWLYGRSAHVSLPLDEINGYEPGGAHLRFHPLRQEWLVVSPKRQTRTFAPTGGDNPLAPATAGGPLTEIPFADFEVAVFENRFPGLSAVPDPAPEAAWTTAPAQGACEVVIYTTDPAASMGTLDDDRRVLLLETLADRARHHLGKGAQFVLPFENRGAEVGATLHHPHGQIYAFPFVPAPQASAARAFAAGYDLVRERERWGEAFEVATLSNAACFIPPFARFPYECWIAPTVRKARLCDMSGAELADLAALMGDCCRRYDRLFARPMPYMMALHAAPAGAEASWHFTVQFYPLLRSADRLKYLAGVEQATGVFTVDVAPEAAAQALREA